MAYDSTTPELFPVSLPVTVTPKPYSIPIYRVALVKEASMKQADRPSLRNSGDVAKILRDYLDDADREHFVVLLLNVKNKVIGINTVSIGSLSSCFVHPREVFKPAILSNASALILGHNHPSGDPTPSQEDLNITRRLREIGEIMGIKVLDHIVVGDNRHYISFVDDGYWDK